MNIDLDKASLDILVLVQTKEYRYKVFIHEQHKLIIKTLKDCKQ